MVADFMIIGAESSSIVTHDITAVGSTPPVCRWSPTPASNSTRGGGNETAADVDVGERAGLRSLGGIDVGRRAPKTIGHRLCGAAGFG